MGNPSQKITHKGLELLLMKIRGATFVSFVACTDARLLKRSSADRKIKNELGDVRKLAVVSAQINFNYAADVERRRRQEFAACPMDPPELYEQEPFWSLPRAWGTRRRQRWKHFVPRYSKKVAGLSPLIDHKRKIYLHAKLKSRRVSYMLPDGTLLDPADVQPFLRKRDRESQRQGVAAEIIVRDYTLTNIRELSVNGVVYILVPQRKRSPRSSRPA